MSAGWLAVLYVAAVNPGRLWPALPAGPRGTRLAAATVAAGLGATAVVGLTAAADAVAGSLDVGPEMLRIAAGGVLLLTAGRTLLAPAAAADPALAGWRAGLVPVGFPLLVGPDIALLALAAGHDPALAEAAAASAAAPALLTVVAIALLPDRSPVARPVAAGVARLLAALQAVLAVALLIDGIRAV